MLELIKELMVQIPKEYYAIKNPIYRNGERIDYSQIVVYPERNYCMYLMHLLLKVREEADNNILNDLAVNAEIYKKMSLASLNSDDPRVITKGKLGTKIGYYPDIIIHKSQNDTKNNILSMEVKTVSDLKQREFDKDLFKTMLYSDVLGYQYSFFIIINNKREKIEKYYTRYIDTYPYYSENENVKIILKENYSSEVFII